MELDLDFIDTDALCHAVDAVTDTLTRCQDRRDVLQAALELLIAHVDAALNGQDTTDDLVAALESVRKVVK